MITNDRELPKQLDSIADDDLARVVGGDVYVEVLGHKITTSDVADAAKWVWNKIF